MARNTKVTFSKVQLDHAGIEEILKTQFVEETRAAADAMAASAAAAMDSPAEDGVVVDGYVADGRVNHSVTIRDPRGLYYERVRGVLSRAAMQQGLEVHPE